MDLLKKTQTPFQDAILLVCLGLTTWSFLGGLFFFLSATPSAFIYFGNWGYWLVATSAQFLGLAYFLIPVLIFKLGALIISKCSNLGELLSLWRRVLSRALHLATFVVAVAALFHVFAIHFSWTPLEKLLHGHGGFCGLWLGGTLYSKFGFSGALLSVLSSLTLLAIFMGDLSVAASLMFLEEKTLLGLHGFKKALQHLYAHSIKGLAALWHSSQQLLGRNGPVEISELRSSDVLNAEKEAVLQNSLQGDFHLQVAVNAPPSFSRSVIRRVQSATNFSAQADLSDFGLARDHRSLMKNFEESPKPQVVQDPIAEEQKRKVEEQKPKLEVLPESETENKVDLKIDLWKKAYNSPPKSLLKLSKKTAAVSATAKKEQVASVEECLASFGLNGKVVAVHNGVRLSMFEFEPASGVKISKVQALNNDLALSLGASSLRILAPIPGKNTIGIEIPSKNPSALSLGDLVEVTQKNKTAVLPFALGKDVYGQVLVEDLSTMPHLLVSGTTGSGKSVFTNCLISSLLFNMSPRDLRFIMIDPKMIELTPYNGIPHLLKPVISDVEEAKGALVWAEQEMDKRYQIFSDVGARNIDSFNQKVKGLSAKALTRKLGKEVDYALEHMPYIVIVIDELADLMITQGKEVERPITRIAQKARACGIHLVLATQRPSAEIVTGLIKTNFPSRISFKVSSSIDSRTILDVSGAEKLLGQGDMLYLPNGKNIVRVQGAYVSEDEVNRLVKHITD